MLLNGTQFYGRCHNNIAIDPATTIKGESIRQNTLWWVSSTPFGVPFHLPVQF